MDKQVLSEYADMKEEIKDLRRRIAENRKAIDRLNNTVVTDSVTCGKKGKKPLRTVKIQGIPNKALARQKQMLNNRIMKLQQLEMDLIEKQNQVEEYIEQISRSELRIMFRLYYLDSLTWYQVAMRMNRMFPKRKIKYTEDNCRIRHNRFLEKVA